MENQYTIKKLLQYINKYPKKHDAELLLLYTIKKEEENTSYLYLNSHQTISKQQLNLFKKLHQKLLSGIPLPYITGFCYIYNLKFYVNKNVLIPRFDTEILIETAFKHIKNINKNLKILVADIATGSGCIIISLAHRLRNRKKISFIASDISKKTLQIAQKNISYHRLKSKINLLCGDMAEPLFDYMKRRKKFDHIVIISNPPYLSEKNYKKYYQNIKYEPQKALLAPNNGLYFYQKLFQQLQIMLKYKVDIDVFLEHNFDQAEKIKKLAENNLPVKTFKTIKDLGDRDRVSHLKI